MVVDICLSPASCGDPSCILSVSGDDSDVSVSGPTTTVQAYSSWVITIP